MTMENKMNKKYKLADETKVLADGTVLHRIRATRTFSLADGTEVKSGDLGGLVKGEYNLSQEGGAWVGDDALVFDNAQIDGNAQVFGEARVFGNSRVYGNAVVSDNACVYSNAHVCEDAWIHGNALVYGNARVFGNAWVCEEACVYGSARVCGIVRVSNEARICGDAEVKKESDYFVAKNVWSSFRRFTYTRSNRKWKVGCFYGTSEELIAKAYRDSEVSGKCYEAIVRAQEAIYKALEEVGK